MVRSVLCVVAVMGSAGLLRSGELVCLKSGFCLHADSHVQTADRLSVQMGGGSLELAAADVASVEALADQAPAATKKAPATVVAIENPRTLLAQAATAEGVDADFVRSVAKVESDFRQDAISRKGAIGLMQIMPATAKGLSIDAFAARENALGGAKYLRELLVRYHGNSALALAAYNAGPGAVERFGGVPPFAETRQYVRRVTREYDRQKAASKPTAKD